MTDTALLTTKQELFIDYYLGEAKGNATRAAELAGYEGSRAVLRRIASDNLTKPAIAAAIRDRLDEIGMTQGEILAELADIARADWRDLIQVRRNRTGEVVDAQFNLRDKLLALELLAKHHGMLKERVEVSGAVERIQIKTIVAVNPFLAPPRLPEGDLPLALPE